MCSPRSYWPVSTTRSSRLSYALIPSLRRIALWHQNRFPSLIPPAWTTSRCVCSASSYRPRPAQSIGDSGVYSRSTHDGPGVRLIVGAIICTRASRRLDSGESSCASRVMYLALLVADATSQPVFPPLPLMLGCRIGRLRLFAGNWFLGLRPHCPELRTLTPDSRRRTKPTILWSIQSVVVSSSTSLLSHPACRPASMRQLSTQNLLRHRCQDARVRVQP
ncbi:hypothetical protein C8Q79DRAFT_515899 [Trametes meyenii]|nr:hypothetical protein C8Q79DRAFT_515899 [Trametes meyenii]